MPTGPNKLRRENSNQPNQTKETYLSGFATEDAAAAALAAANADEVAPVEVAPVEQAPVVEAPAVDAGTTETDSFTNIDISGLPEELRTQLEDARKSMQADYTRKTQEIAPVRKLMEESGMSLEDAQQALSFAQSLSDPAVQRQLYETLHTSFGEEPATELDPNVDPRDQQIEQLSTRLETWEQRQAMNDARATLAEAQQAVKSAHPDFTDADLTRVEQLAVSHMQGGKDIGKALTDAATEFAGYRDDIIAKYIQDKGGSGAGGSPLGGTSGAETPGKFANLDEASKAALARFGQDWVN